MLNFLPGAQSELKPRITVIGVGGAGGNAVNNMISSKLEGVEFIVANTDAQSLNQSRTERRIQLGAQATQGLGAGSRPDVGRMAAEESMDEIITQLGQSNMVFITAGMGGGTGSGAAPVIARTARDQGILTVGVVTKPFHFEGAHRMRTAEAAIEELSQYVDTLIIIPNQNLFRIATERTTFADAFKMADDVLYSGVRGVTDLMIMPGLINLDFADIRTVMSEMGKAMMGTGEAEGEKRSIEAAEAAISNPLLDDTSMKGAKGVLINITGGLDMTLFEVDEAANRIRDEVDPEANIIFGSTFDDKLNGKIRVSVVATGIASEAAQQPKPTVISLLNANAAQAGQKVVTAPAQAGGAFRPTVVAQQPAVAQTIVQTAPVVARGQVNTARAVIQTSQVQPAPVQAVQAAPVQIVQAAPVQAELPVAPPMQAPQRAEPAMTAPQPDMADLNRAVSEIAEKAAAQHLHAEPRVEAPRPEARPQPSTSHETEARRPGLFDRLMPGRRVQATREEHRNTAPAQAASPAPMPAQAAPQPRVGRSDTTIQRTGEDYEIPAFLRRQAN